MRSGKEGGYFYLGNNDGKTVAAISAGKEGGYFYLDNNDGKTVASISPGKEGGYLALLNNDGADALSASASKTGGYMQIESATNGMSTAVGGFGISVNKRQGRERLSLFDAGINDGGGGFVAVRNPAGATVAQMQCNKANAGLIMVNDFNGKTQESLSGD